MTSARRAARPPLVRARERARLREPVRRRDGLHGLASCKQLGGKLATHNNDDRARRRLLLRELAPQRPCTHRELRGEAVERGILRERRQRRPPHALDERAPHRTTRELGNARLERRW